MLKLLWRKSESYNCPWVQKSVIWFIR